MEKKTLLEGDKEKYLLINQNCILKGGNRFSSVQFSSVQLLSRVRPFGTPCIAALQASLSITTSWSSLKLTVIESVMPSSHLILCRPLFLLPPIPPSIRVFSNESTLRMRWPKYWSFSFLASFLPGYHTIKMCTRIEILTFQESGSKRAFWILLRIFKFSNCTSENSKIIILKA